MKLDMLANLLTPLLKNLPPDVLAQITQIGQICAAYKGQLDRIEQQNRMIIDHLGITENNGDGKSN